MTAAKGKLVPDEVNFLTDQPAEEDRFGPHSRVAEAVASTISRDDAVQVIGLLGGWGSGKSTVVRQIEKLLDAGDSIYFFSYDAWLHQNDPPRRAFLEELIGELSVGGLVDGEGWKLRLAELSGKAEETTTETTRQFSETGRAIFLALAFVPFGLGFLDYELIDKALGSGGNGIARPLLTISIAAVLAPLLVIFWFYMKWRPLKPKGTEGRWKAVFDGKFWLEHDDARKDQSVVALLTNHSVENAQNRTRISPEPTAIEFRTVFNDILDSCRKAQKRLVIVIDNLDRLAEEDAMQLWATTRSLFLGSNRALTGSESLPPPTIILPIDEGAIKRMFETHHDGAQAARLSESFIDKTFDITFQINEPVMSDWRIFFADKLDEAFGPLATKHAVYWASKIVEQANIEGAASRRMTPRKLIKLINGAAALFVQWSSGTINLLTMIYYVSHRTKISENVATFVSGDHPVILAAVPDWRRELLALHYGVDLDKAFQTFLGDDIRATILANNREGFDELIARPGALEVAEAVIADVPLDPENGAPEGDFVMNSALLVSGSMAKDEIWAKRALSELSQKWPDVAAPNSWRSDFEQLIALFLPEPSASATYVAGSARILGDMLTTKKLNEEGVVHVSGALRALRDVAKKHESKMPIVQINRPVDDLFTLLPALDETDRAALRSHLTPTEITDALVTRLNSEELSESVPEIIRSIASSLSPQFKDGKKIVWDEVAQAAYDNLVNRNFDDDLTGPALDTIGLLRSRNSLAKTLNEQLFDSGRLAEFAVQADNNEDEAGLGDVIGLMLLRGSDFNAPNGKNWADLIEQRPKFTENVSTALFWYLWKDGLPFALEALPTRPTVAPLIWALANDDIEKRHAAGISTAFLFSNIDAIELALGSEALANALASASTRDDFWSNFEAHPIGSTFDRVIKAIVTSDTVDRSRLVEFVRSRLDAVTADGWSDAILNGAAPSNLAKIYRDELGQTKPLGNGLRSALAEQVGNLLKCGSEERVRWFEFSQFVTKSARVTLYLNLRDALLAGADVLDLPDLIGIGGASLLKEGKFENEADKSSRHIVQPLTHSVEGRELIVAFSPLFAPIVSASEDETRAVINEYLASAKDEIEDSVEIEAVVSALKL